MAGPERLVFEFALGMQIVPRSWTPITKSLFGAQFINIRSVYFFNFISLFNRIFLNFRFKHFVPYNSTILKRRVI